VKFYEGLAAARGEKKADFLLKNGRIVDVFSGEIFKGDIAVSGGRILGFGDYQAEQVLDLENRIAAPGFIDAHVHIESAMVGIPRYAAAVMPRGTTSVVIDPHEIANVLGNEGIRYMIRSSKASPLGVHVMVPSCVPATHLETSGSALSVKDIKDWMGRPGIVGLAEMMNFPGVVNGDKKILAKLEAASGRVRDGHAPGLSGKSLNTYVFAGIGSDHECFTLEEAGEKVRLGMMVFIREGTAAKNLRTLLPVVNPMNQDRFAFCTDDRHPFDLLREGHIDFMVREAVRQGMNPVTAVRLASFNAARYFRLPETGAIAPGYHADIAVFDDFESVAVKWVMKNGCVVAQDGKMLVQGGGKPEPRPKNTIRMKPFKKEDLEVRAAGPVRVIGLIPDQIVTKALVLEPEIREGKAVSSPAKDMLKLIVAERHKATGNLGIGFVCGFGLKRGALASSVAHDSHNIIAVGVDDEDILLAVRNVAAMHGGLAAAAGGQVLEKLPLPIAGLMSPEPMEEVQHRIQSLNRSAAGLGCVLKDPFMQLSFLALPVIPELKLTDRGLVDLSRFDFVPLNAEAPAG